MQTRVPFIAPPAQAAVSARPPVDTGIELDRSNRCALEIASEIGRLKGAPLPFSRCMEIALFGEHGYYSSGTLHLGTAERAHFATACNTSPLFGAVIGKAALRTWEALGKPDHFTLCEMGAGEAHLAKNLIPWAKEHHPEFYQALHYTIVERSCALAARQAEVLERWIGEQKVSWTPGCAYSGRLPRIQNGMFFSNELPDTFPVELVRNNGGKAEQLYIGLQNERWCLDWQSPSADVRDYLERVGEKIPRGHERAVNLFSLDFQRNVANALERGAVLTIDYRTKIGSKIAGQALRVFGPKTSQFIDVDRGTQPVPLEFLCESWGMVDITSDPDYRVMSGVARENGLKPLFENSQQLFVEALGTESILEPLARRIAEIGANPAGHSASELLLLAKRASDLRHSTIEQFGPFHVMMHSRGLNAPFSWDNEGTVAFLTGKAHSMNVARFDYFFSFSEARDGFNPRDTAVQRHQYFTPLMPAIPIFVGEPNHPVRITAYPYNVELQPTTDERGAVHIPADLLWGAKVLEVRERNGRMLLDLTSEEALLPALRRSGYGA